MFFIATNDFHKNCFTTICFGDMINKKQNNADKKYFRQIQSQPKITAVIAFLKIYIFELEIGSS